MCLGYKCCKEQPLKKLGICLIPKVFKDVWVTNPNIADHFKRNDRKDQ